MRKKYCRLCVNSNGWVSPSGEASIVETKGSYVQLNGFGHEEWLFDFAKLLSGYNGSSTEYQYGFLQPLAKYRTKYQGSTFAVKLYTYMDRIPYFVGIINSVHVIDDGELSWVYTQYNNKGWISEMTAQVKAINGKSEKISAAQPLEIINVRFLKKDVELFNFWELVPREHKLKTCSYYHPFDWSQEDDQKISQNLDSRKEIHDPRSEEIVQKKAVNSSQFIPWHNKIQNGLVKRCEELFGEDNVFCEKDCVDIYIKANESIGHVEIKTDQVAKMCIRNAIGQLLEYSYFPGRQSADWHLIVGQEPGYATALKYCTKLRNRFDIPVAYACWDREKEDLLDYDFLEVLGVKV